MKRHTELSEIHDTPLHLLVYFQDGDRRHLQF